MTMISEMKINRNLKIPYYHQLYEKLLENIERNVFPEGYRLAGEMELCQTYGVSRITVRQALKELEINGYIVRERGRGTFIKRQIETHSLQKVSSIIDELKSEGVKTVNKILLNEIKFPDEKTVAALKISNREKILFVKRLVFAYGSPLYLTKAYMPLDMTGFIESSVLCFNSFTKIVTELLGLKLIHSRRVLEADIPDEEVSGLLGLSESAKKVINYLQTYWTVVYKNNERLIYFEEFFNPAKGRFIFERDY
ncbi:MAG: GntR family transcriptional regulator [Actinobacteria bacterium]|nr:GntR family transcriptional regulator [Actinomycetota bacterium]